MVSGCSIPLKNEDVYYSRRGRRKQRALPRALRMEWKKTCFPSLHVHTTVRTCILHSNNYYLLVGEKERKNERAEQVEKQWAVPNDAFRLDAEPTCQPHL